MYRAIFLILVLGAAALSPAEAAFETLGRAVRASAMSDAFVVLADDASALWYNTAGLAGIEHRQILADYARLFPDLDAGPDINSWALNYVQGVAGGRVGLGVAGLGADFYNETGAVVGYGRSFGKRLSLGLGLRLLRWSADGYQDPVSGLSDEDRSGSGLGVDVGVHFGLLRWQEGVLNLGFSGQNLNEPDVSESGGPGIPRRLSLGLGYEDPVYAVEANVEFADGDSRLRVGGEYRLGGSSDLRLRAGASGIAGEGAAGGIDGGVGLRLGGVVLNFAYHYSSEIAAGGGQRFSLGYQF